MIDRRGSTSDIDALDRAWVALQNFGEEGTGWRLMDWIEGALWRRDLPNEETRAMIRVIVDAYNDG